MEFTNVFNSMLNRFNSFAILKLAVDPNLPDLVKWYKQHVDAHNQSILNDPFPNSGFDLFVPCKTSVDSIYTSMISMNVKCEMLDHQNTSCGYFMFPRSSISKTPLILSNHTGIIDSGYRGWLIGAFRNLALEPYTVEEKTRLLQVCHPSLCPVYVVLVDESDLSTTLRGTGGFGSTGL